MAGSRRETPHGTLSCRKYRGCDRPECVAAALAYEARRRRLMGYGRWNPLVDAEPARQHLRKLNGQGCSYRSIADALGKYTAAITHIVFTHAGKSRTQRIRPELSAAILALTVEDVRPPRVSAVGTSRRVRALNLVGWPNTVIGERIGKIATHVNHIHHQRQVLRETAEAIQDLYETLKGLDPVEHGVDPHTARTVAGKARVRGARDPLWWEDWGGIDDPKFDPAAIEQELNVRQLGALRRDEIEHLGGYGLNAEQIAERLGMAYGTVRDIMRELRTERRRDRGSEAAA